jgi:anaerobic magnesium-protoporphyrin IX monomethyl ester cyclase
VENTDAVTINTIRKGSTTSIDREAIRLLREHGIISMATWVVGFEEESDADHWRGLKQLLSYDPDQIQFLYVTPHRWTSYYTEAADRRVIQTDRRRWDYKHQVLETRYMPPWRVLLWVKFTEAVLQARPKALYRTYLQPDQDLRHAMRWYTRIGRRVWPYEIIRFLHERLCHDGPTVGEMWGVPQDNEELPMRVLSSGSYQESMPASIQPHDCTHASPSFRYQPG